MQAGLNDLWHMRPALHFGLVRTAGTPVGPIRERLRRILCEFGYLPVILKLSKCFRDVSLFDSLIDESDRFVSYVTRMSAGDQLRTLAADAGILVSYAGHKLATDQVDEEMGLAHDYWQKTHGPSLDPRGVGLIYESLMHPSEVERLRSLFGPTAFVIAATDPLRNRHENLYRKMKAGFASRRDNDSPYWHLGIKPDKVDVAVERVMRRETERALLDFEPAERIDVDNMLDVVRTFEQSDVFVSPSSDETLVHIDRMVDCIFAYPFASATKDELGMAAAFLAQRMTTDLSRRVGAAILSRRGDVVSLGANEVPAGGGWIYRENPGGSETARDFERVLPEHVMPGGERGFDPNDYEKSLLFVAAAEDVVQALDRGGFIPSDREPEDLLREILASPEARSSAFKSVTEYGRTAHAEMAAVFSAASRGVSTDRSLIYTTTYPCHNCARHIIAAGVAEVVYLEAYPKSRVADLHDDAVDDSWNSTRTDPKHFSSGDNPGRVVFRPFIGVSPRAQPRLYSWTARKQRDLEEGEGDVGDLVWNPLAVKWSRGSTASIRRTVDPREGVPDLGETQDEVLTNSWEVMNKAGAIAADAIERMNQIRD